MTDPSQEPDAEVRILERSEHPISRKNISEPTLKVLYRLNRAGHKAYLVGGGVRDLLLDRRPKDFDVVTDARPEQVRKLFRNSRVIGRRFRLVHVFFHKEVVEVATFRAPPDPDQQSDEHEMLITSDNTWGTPREDAFRRDFTCNALFYDIDDYSVIDYVGGVDDLEDGLLRTIGDPWVRFREDPVRMLRACEFAGRLDFEIDEDSQQAILELRQELEKASTARITEEIVQLVRCGHAGPAFDWMRRLGLDRVLLPELAAFEHAERVGLGDPADAWAVLDEHLRDRRRKVSDAVPLGLLLLPRVMLRRRELEQGKRRPLSRKELEKVVESAVQSFQGRFNLSRARSQDLHWLLLGFFLMVEPKLNEAQRKRIARRPFFDDALKLFEILAEASGEGDDALAQWRKIDQARERRLAASRGSDRGRSRRRRPRRRRN